MIAVIKKKTIIVCLVVIVAIAVAVGAGAVVKASTLASISLGKTVVIDAGHGGIDGGVSGVNSGIKESQINLAIAKSLKNYLERSGYSVVMTRSNNDGLYDSSASNKKRSDMEKRRQIIERAKPDLVVSIHQNYYPLSSVKGAQVFYSENSETGRAYATVMQNALNGSLGCERAVKSGDYFVLNATAYPALLIECGFLSNPEEERLLVKATYQKKIAYAIFGAIHSLIGENDCAHDKI